MAGPAVVLSFAHKMPPPGKLGRGRGGDDMSEDPEEQKADDAEEHAPEREQQLAAVRDFFEAGKSGDMEAALDAFLDLKDLCGY